MPRGIDQGYERLASVSRIRLPNKPRGGMYIFFSLPDTPNSREACMSVLEASRVGLAPGSMFGTASSQFLRMCVCRIRRN